MQSPRLRNLLNVAFSAIGFGLLIAGLAAHCNAQSIAIDHFMGLHDDESSAAIDDKESQDCLNVEQNHSATAIIKRPGYSVLSTLAVATSPVTGSYSFIDPNGNRQDIVCQDRLCYKSTNQGTFQIFIGTAGSYGIPTRWSFVSVGGVLYGANDQRDSVIKYDGTTLSHPASIPKGSILELTTSRLVVGDVSSDPNRIYYSSAGNYDQFYPGINSYDPYYDDIGATGDRITGIKWARGKLYIFKTQSITGCILGDQYSSRCYPISSILGTRDPSSIVEAPDGIYFRGNDRHYWKIDDAGMHLLSKNISNLVLSQTSGFLQNNTQSSKNDWLAGTPCAGGAQSCLDATTIPGSVTPGHWTMTDAASGTPVNVDTYTNTGNMQLALSPGFTNGGTTYLDTLVWKDSFANGNYTTGSSTWALDAGAIGISGSYAYQPSNSGCGGATDCSGLGAIHTDSNVMDWGHWQFRFMVTGNQGYGGCAAVNGCCQPFGCTGGSTGSCGGACADYRFQMQDDNNYYAISINSNGNSASKSISLYKVVSGAATTLTSANVTSYNGQYVKFVIEKAYLTGVINVYADDAFLMTATDTSIDPMGKARLASYYNTSAHGSMYATSYIGDIYGYTTQKYQPSGYYTSPVYDTGFSTPVGGPFGVTVSSPAGTTLDFYVRQATSPYGTFSGWSSITASTSARVAQTQEFVQYYSTFSTTIASTTPTMSYVTLNAATTGQYISQCIQTGSNISAFGAISCSEVLSGKGSVSYYVSTGATCSDSRLGVWKSQTNQYTITATTATAVKFRFDPSITSSTDSAQVDACTIYWTNGSAAQPVWGIYESNKNAIYFSAGINDSPTNNRFLKYDLNWNEWFPMDLAVSAPIITDGVFYFGSPSSGKWNRYGPDSTAVSDNGADINAYWKSKDYGGGDPFVEKNLNRISLVTKNRSTGSMGVTYQTSNSASGTYTVSLSTSSPITYVRANYALPLLSPYQLFSVKFGNNSTVPWEINGFRLDYSLQPWKPMNP